MHIFYGSFKVQKNILALLWSFPFWLGLQIFIYQGCCHILIPIKWNAKRQSLNFEKILIKVFTNRVNLTRKRWAVNNNFYCLLFELQGVSKKGTFLELVLDTEILVVGVAMEERAAASYISELIHLLKEINIEINENKHYS